MEHSEENDRRIEKNSGRKCCRIRQDERGLESWRDLLDFEIHCIDKTFRNSIEKERKLTENELSLSNKLILYGKSPVFKALRDPIGHPLV